VRVSVFGRLVERLDLHVASAAETATGLVESDADEPGAEFGVAAEVSEVAEGFEEGLLRSVFGVGFVVEQRESHNVDASLVGANEVVKLVRVAGEDGGDDLRLASAFREFRHASLSSLREATLVGTEVRGGAGELVTRSCRFQGTKMLRSSYGMLSKLPVDSSISCLGLPFLSEDVELISILT
jgi:hypothetical protein